MQLLRYYTLTCLIYKFTVRSSRKNSLSEISISWAPLRVDVSQADGRFSLMDVHSLGKGV